MAIVEGIVQHGDARGRQLGFPTANIPCPTPDGLEGVWAGRVETGPGEAFLATISVGRRTTFHGDCGPCLLEAHLLDYSGDLYGRRLIVHLVHFLRPQRRFEEAGQLVAQLREDVRNTQDLGANLGPVQRETPPVPHTVVPTR